MMQGGRTGTLNEGETMNALEHAQEYADRERKPVVLFETTTEHTRPFGGPFRNTQWATADLYEEMGRPGVYITKLHPLSTTTTQFGLNAHSEGETMDTGINWDAVRRQMDAAEWEQGEDGCEFRAVWLGTALGLTPSGKIYTPFACSNVTEAEAEADEEWRERLEAEAEERGMYISDLDSGGDIYACEWRTTEGGDDA